MIAIVRKSDQKILLSISPCDLENGKAAVQSNGLSLKDVDVLEMSDAEFIEFKNSNPIHIKDQEISREKADLKKKADELKDRHFEDLAKKELEKEGKTFKHI